MLSILKVEAAGEKALYVGAFYRSSVSDTEKLSPLKDSVTSLCHSTQSHIWLTGDFNLPDMEWNPRSVRNGARYSDSYQVFMDMLDEYGKPFGFLFSISRYRKLFSDIGNSNSRYREIIPDIGK